MSKRTLSLVGIAIVLLLIGCYYGSPYWAFHQMRAAGEAGEGDRLASYVDFPAMRESLKSQMQAMMVKQMQSDSMKDNPFAVLGMALAGGMVNTLVDGMVTPESVASMVSSGKAKPEAGKGTPASTPAANTTSGKPAAKAPRVDRHYEGMDVFHVEMHDPDRDKLMLTLVLNREGWFGWKLKSVRMPAWTDSINDSGTSRGSTQREIQKQEDAERELKLREIQKQKVAEREAIDTIYRERRAKERAEKIAEFNADPTKILQRLRKLIQAGRVDEACGMAADFDGVVNDELTKLRQSIESKVGVNCSN